MSKGKDSSLSWPDLLEALPDGTALLDEHGVIFHVNDMLTILTGYTSNQLVGQNVTMLVPPHLRDQEDAARREDGRDSSGRLMSTGQDLTVLCRDGSELPVDFSVSPVTFEGRSWAVASIRDNSATRALDRARRDAESRAVEIVWPPRPWRRASSAFAWRSRTIWRPWSSRARRVCCSR